MKLNILNYKHVLAIAFMGLAVCISSCKDDEEGITGFRLDKESIELPDNGGEVALQISTNERWTASSDADWYMITPANGESSAVCVVKADSSYMYTQREGLITFRTVSGEYTVKIQQGGYERAIKFESLQDDTLHVPHYKPLDEAYVDIEATANVSYKVVIPETAREWLYFKDENSPKYEEEFNAETTIPRKQKVRLYFKTHIEWDSERRADLQYIETGRTDGIVSEVGVIQEKAPRIIPSRTGDSLALLTVARMLNVGVPWNTSRPITHWNNVKTRPVTYTYNDGTIEEERTEERVVGFTLSMIETKESLPDQLKYLDQLETLAITSNSNSYIKEIELGDVVTTLKKLKSLSLFGYGISKLPASIGDMENLEELNLSANTFQSLDDVIKPLKNLGPKLKYLNLASCRIVDGDATKNLADTPNGIDPVSGRHIGLTGTLPKEIFTYFPNMEYLNLSYNYLHGQVPDLAKTDFEGGEILPKLKYLSINLNRFTGKLPQWMINHEYRGCWGAAILILNQEGRDYEGDLSGFDNEREFTDNMPDCPTDEEEEAQLLNLPILNDAEKAVAAEFSAKYPWEKYGNNCPIYGNWRYYNRIK